MSTKSRLLLVAVVAVVAAIQVAAGTDDAPVFITGDAALEVERVMGDMADTTVNCIAGAPAEAIAPGGLGGGAATTLCVKNRSTTCVSLGGPTVVHPGPTVIGSGCEDGMMACVNTRRIWCDAATGTISVGVLWGTK